MERMDMGFRGGPAAAAPEPGGPVPAAQAQAGGEINFGDLAVQLIKYLHLNDLKQLRLVNSVFNNAVNIHPEFPKKFTATISKSFYDFARGANRNSRIEFKYFRLNHFAYHRNVDIFKIFWAQAGQTITHLTLSNSSYECDGFAFILNNLPVLNTLVLTAVKLRDLDNHHNIQILRPELQLPAPNHCQVENIREPLKHITFDNVNYIENCFMDYLIQRTSELESVTLTSCFQPRTNNPYIHAQRGPRPPVQVVNEVVNAAMVNDAVDQTRLTALFDQFKYYLRQILDKNGAHIKKVTLNNNFRTSELLPLFTGVQALALTELCVDIRTEERPGIVYGVVQVDTIPLVRALVGHCGNTLKKLSLDFFKTFTSAQLTQLLLPAMALQDIKLRYDHSSLPMDENLVLDVLHQMPLLEKIQLTDKATVNKNDLKGLKNARLDENQRNIIFNRLNSKVNPGFLLQLPGTVTALKLQSIQHIANFMAPMNPADRARLLASFQNLSTLEIKGPWIHDIAPTLDTIYLHLRQLQSLSLINCNVRDVHLTGLQHDTARELRKSNLLLAPIYLGNVPPLPANPFPFLNPVLVDGIPKRSLADMNQLLILDLSQNSGVTNVTIGYTLPRIPQLRSLAVSSCHNINDGGLDLIGHYMAQLEEVNVKHVRRISAIGLNSVINGCKKLKRLYVSKKVSNPPAPIRGAARGGIHFLTTQAFLRVQLNPHYHEVVRASEEEDPMEEEPASEGEEED